MGRLLRAGTALVIGVGLLSPMTSGASAATSVQVSGKVIGGSGVLASDAEISLWGPSQFTVSPDAKGAFAAVVPTGVYTVIVRSPYWISSPWHFRIDGVSITEDVDWTLQLPDRVRVRTMAKNSSGAPVVGAEVVASRQVGDPVQLTPGLPAFSVSYDAPSVSTGPDGRAIVRALPDSDLTLRVIQRIGGSPCVSDGTVNILPLKTPSRVSVDASQDVSVVARSLPLHTTRVSIREHTGEAVTGGFCVTGEWGSTYATLDASGRASFVLPESRATLSMSGGSSGWQLPSRWSFQQPLDITDDNRIRLTLPETAKVTATVTDADTGHPAVGVFVSSRGSPDAVVLAQGLEPAILENTMMGDTKADGTVRLRTFPDSTFQVRAIEREPGAYRQSPIGEVDATSDTAIGLTLPESATVSVVVTEADGSLATGQRAGVRVNDDHTPFAVNSDGTLTMKLAADDSVARLEVALPQLNDGPCPAIKREVVVRRDIMLSYTLPEFHDVTLVMHDSLGHRLPGAKVDVTGGTTVLSDEGPIRVRQCLRLIGDEAGVAIRALPQTERADFRLLTTPEGAVLDVPITEPRRLVIRAGVTTSGDRLS